MIGDHAHPLVLAIGWSELEGMPERPVLEGDGDMSWLIAAAANATTPAHAVAIAVSSIENEHAVSPDRAALATMEDDDPDGDGVEVAIGDRGARLAVASVGSLALYHRDGAKLASIYAHAMHGASLAKLQFSTDGQRLAVAGASLVVLGPKADARVRQPAPHLARPTPSSPCSRSARWRSCSDTGSTRRSAPRRMPTTRCASAAPTASRGSRRAS